MLSSMVLTTITTIIIEATITVATRKRMASKHPPPESDSEGCFRYLGGHLPGKRVARLASFGIY